MICGVIGINFNTDEVHAEYFFVIIWENGCLTRVLHMWGSVSISLFKQCDSSCMAEDFKRLRLDVWGKWQLHIMNFIPLVECLVEWECLARADEMASHSCVMTFGVLQFHALRSYCLSNVHSLLIVQGLQ